MTTEVLFSPKLLHDFDRLKGFFSGEKELRKINHLSKESIVLPKKRSLYFDRFQVVWIIIIAPYKHLYSVFTWAIAHLLHCLCLESASRYLFVASEHMTREWEYLWSQWKYGSRLLVPTINTYQLNTSDVYSLSSTRREHLPLPILRNSLSHLLRKVNFSRIHGGICHGGTCWFNYLFTKGHKEKRDKSIVQLAVSVAKLFEHGQPRQAGLIQSLYGLENALLYENRRMDYRVPFHNNQALADGVYYLRFYVHAISYIKCGKDQLIWDPGIGLVQIENAKQLNEIVAQYKNEKFEGYFLNRMLF